MPRTNNRSTFNILFYLNKSKMKKNGLCPLFGRITIDGSIAQYSCKLDAEPKLWDAKIGRMLGKSSMSIEINKELEKFDSKIKLIYKELLDQSSYITAEQVKNALLGIGCKAKMLLVLFNEHNVEFDKRIGIDRVEGTAYTYRLALKNLSKFILYHYGKTDYHLKQLDYSFIDNFDYYLRVNRKMSVNSILNNIIPLRKIITRAINEGTLLRDLFVDYVPQKAKRNRRHLSIENLQKLLTTHIEHKGNCFVRDMFIFGTFTGLSYIDIYYLTEKQLVKEDDGSLWIMTHRQKTGEESNIFLLDIPIQIIEKYRSARKSDKIFNMINKTSICRNLRAIEKICKIDVHLQFHQSRHTYATAVCISGGMPIETLSKTMGHKSVCTTQIYAEITNQKVNSDMKALSSRISGKYTLPEDGMQVKLSRNQSFK